VIWVGDPLRDGPAEFFKSGKIPPVGEIPALLRLDGLHRTIFTLQKDALVVGLFHQGQPLAIRPQPGELLDELRFAHSTEGGQPGDFRLRQTHLPRPATAGGATLTHE